MISCVEDVNLDGIQLVMKLYIQGVVWPMVDESTRAKNASNVVGALATRLNSSR